MIFGYWYYCVSYNLGVTLGRSPANTHVIYLAFAKMTEEREATAGQARVAMTNPRGGRKRGNGGAVGRRAAPASRLARQWDGHFVSHAFH